jgi:hypothetical protein
MARLDDIEGRLRRWARWKPGAQSGGLGFASCDMAAERVDGGGHGAVVQDGEEAITDLAVMSLERELCETVHVVYVTGGSRARKAQRLGIAEATIDTRIWLAHRQLSRWFSERQQLQQQERARVEALQRTAAVR